MLIIAFIVTIVDIVKSRGRVQTIYLAPTLVSDRSFSTTLGNFERK